MAVEKDSGAVASISLPSKEAITFAAEFVTSFIDRLGLTTVTLRTDGEPAIVKLAELVKGRRTHWTSLQQAPKHSSASIGAVERAHWEIQSQTKTPIAQMEAAYQVKIGHADTTWPWAVRHAGWLMHRYLVKSTGQTAYSSIYGKDYRKEICPFGETILIKAPVPERRGPRPEVGAQR